MKKKLKLAAFVLVILMSSCSLCLAIGVIGAIGGLAYAVGDAYSPVVFVADAYGALVVKMKAEKISVVDSIEFKDTKSSKDVSESDPCGVYNGTLTAVNAGGKATLNGTLSLSQINKDLKTAFPTIKELTEPVSVIFEDIVVITDQTSKFYTGMESGVIYVGSKTTNWKVDLGATGKVVGFFKESSNNINEVIEDTFK